VKNYHRFLVALASPLFTLFAFQQANSATINRSENSSAEVTIRYQDALKKQALRTLRDVMKQESEWVKVHAAEFLIWSGYPEGVKEEFLKEEKLFGDKSQYRIGIARVLAQAAKTEAERRVHTDKILRAFTDLNGTDRIHAIETLAKLKISPVKGNAQITRDALRSSMESLAIYTQWSVAFTSPDSLQQTKTKMLQRLANKSSSSGAKGTAAYLLRNLGGLTNEEWKVLADAALTSEQPSVYLCSAAWVTAPKQGADVEKVKLIRERLLQFQSSPSKGDRMELCMALSIKGTKADLPLLTALLNGVDPLATDSETVDVKAAAAYAILKKNLP
jgi:hypothetical protein